MRPRRAGHHSAEEASARALAAMAEAARRSRHAEMESKPRRTGVEGQSAPPPTHAVADVPAPSPGGGSTASTPRERRLSRPILMVSMGLVAAIVALVSWSSIKGGGTPNSHRSSASVPRSSPATRASPLATNPPTTSSSTIPPPASSPGAVPVSTTTSTTTSTAPASEGAPVLSAVDPSSGTPGQIVVITGTNFVSPSGQITVQFGTQVATIACPEQTACLVAVPPPAGTAGSTPVTVTTDAGTSNPLTFTYG
jgi:hypothetical protein